MTLESNPLWFEVNKIFSTGVKATAFSLNAQIHTPKETFEPLFVNSMDIVANYINRHLDIIYLELAIPQGDLNFRLIPYQKDLEITITKTRMLETISPLEDQNTVVQSARYRAILPEAKSPLLEAKLPTDTSLVAGNKADFRMVSLQLYPSYVENLRTVTVGATFRNMRGVDVIAYLFKKHADGRFIKDVQILGKPNPEIREHIIVPNLTPLMRDMPGLVNKICGGIYPSGFRYYLHQGHWYLYSPYDIEAYKSNSKSLTILNIPASRMRHPERTYRISGDQVIIIATGDPKHVDESEKKQVNHGNGVRFVDASRVMEGFVTAQDNKAVVDKANNISEFVGSNRDNGVNVVYESPDRITANYLTEYARLAERMGSYIQYAWESSDPDVLYPGMPVKLLYLEEKLVRTIYGVLVGAQTYCAPTTHNPAMRRFNPITTLTIFIDRNLPTPTS